jgi:hypothetical protein
MCRSPDWSGELPWGVECGVGQFNVRRSLAASIGVGLDIKLHLLPFLNGVKNTARQGRMVEEDFGTVLTADKAEPTVSDHPHDCALHETLPPGKTPTSILLGMWEEMRRKIYASKRVRSGSDG